MIKELLDSNNVEDVILGIRMLTKEDLDSIFMDYSPNFNKIYGHRLIIDQDYNIVTDLGTFWINRSSGILFTTNRIGFFKKEITLIFKDGNTGLAEID